MAGVPRSAVWGAVQQRIIQWVCMHPNKVKLPTGVSARALILTDPLGEPLPPDAQVGETAGVFGREQRSELWMPFSAAILKFRVSHAKARNLSFPAEKTQTPAESTGPDVCLCLAVSASQRRRLQEAVGCTEEHSCALSRAEGGGQVSMRKGKFCKSSSTAYPAPALDARVHGAFPEAARFNLRSIPAKRTAFERLAKWHRGRRIFLAVRSAA